MDTHIGGPQGKVSIEALGVGGLQDGSGQRFPQGGPDVTEGHGAVSSGADGVYSAGSQSGRPTPSGLSISPALLRDVVWCH